MGCQGGRRSRGGGRAQAVVAVGGGESGKTAEGVKTLWQAK